MKPQSPADLRAAITAAGNYSYLVDKFIPTSSICIFAGESSLGKTPLMVQLSVCVASGLPFLGMEVRPGPVLYADFEQSPSKFDKMSRDISIAIGLSDTPPGLYRIPLSTPNEVEAAFNTIKPSLLIIDTLRLLDPTAEKDNSCAGLRIAWLRKFTKEGGVVIFIHHLCKPNPDNPRPWLGEESVRCMHWMDFASGAGALVNNSDVRIGFDEAKGDLYDSLLRAYVRATDEFGPLRLRRIYDDNSGEPQAYEIAPEPIKMKANQEPLIAKLPRGQFTFKVAVETLNKPKKFVINLLKQGISAGQLLKTGEGKDTRYERIQ